MYPQNSPNIEAAVMNHPIPAEPDTPTHQEDEPPNPKDESIHHSHGQQEEIATKSPLKPHSPTSISTMYNKMLHLYHSPKTDDSSRSSGEHLARLLLLRIDIPAAYRVRAHMVLACGPIDYLWHARRAITYAEREVFLLGEKEGGEEGDLLEQARRVLGRAEEDWIDERCDFQVGDEGEGGKEEESFCTGDGGDYACGQVIDMDVEQGERGHEGVERKDAEDEKNENSENEEGKKGGRGWRSRFRRLRRLTSN